MSSPASLRDLYSDPGSAWSFVQQPISISPANSTVSPSDTPSSFQWSARPPHNSIFDLSPDLNDVSEINLVHVFKSLVASALLQYSSTAIAMPWEVGKLLLQVQWVPKDVEDSDIIQDVPDDEDTPSDSDNENDSYFADPGATPSRSRDTRADEHTSPLRRAAAYDDDGTRPEYIIPVGPQDGVWGMIKRVGRFRAEGWLALWKGLLTSCCTEVLSSTLQPITSAILQSLFFSASTPYHEPPFLLPVASHLLTGLLLSPLDLVRTRLIVQSFLPQHRSYSGPIDALNQILRDEGGFWGIYFHPQLLIPAILDNALRPLISVALPGLLASYVGSNISADANPIAWGLAELTGSCIGLLVTLPFETVRRRLQVQVRGSAKPIAGCVELRPASYHGVIDTFWHILSEERSDVPLHRNSKKRRTSRGGASAAKERGLAMEEVATFEEGGWFRSTGIGQLYRGMSMRLGASVIVFILAIVSGGEDGDSGWAEL